MKKMQFKMILAVIFTLMTMGIFGQVKDSRYDAGMNLPFNEKAGDVNPQTGNITLGFTDLSLPGRAGMDFNFGRIWSVNQAYIFSMYRDGIDGENKISSDTIEKYNHLGTGWSASIPYIYKDYSSGEEVINLFISGSVYEIDPSSYTNELSSQSNIRGYTLLDKRVYQVSEISYADFNLYALSDLQTEYSVADSAVTQNYYKLVLKDNSKYYFRQDGRLMMQEDKTGINEIWYFYDSYNRLRLVVDTVGRKIRFTYDIHDNLIEVSWLVKSGQKNGEVRVFENESESRKITYTYENGETINAINDLKNDVINYQTPYLLKTVTDPMGNVTQYDWTIGPFLFTYNSQKSHSSNLMLLLSSITSAYDSSDGSFLNKRCFEYAVPDDEMYRHYFYTGFVEYYKISRQFMLNRMGDAVNDTKYTYHDNHEDGNNNQYSTVIQLGNLKTKYVYSLVDTDVKRDVLEELIVQSGDGFKQSTIYTYNDYKIKKQEDVFRQGSKIYDEEFTFDRKGNLTYHKGKKLEDYNEDMRLKTNITYWDQYSIPRQITKSYQANGQDYIIKEENLINGLGQVTDKIIYLKQSTGEYRAVTVAKMVYDNWGNVTSVEDNAGNKVYTVFDDTYHTFPVKIYQDVEIDKWLDGTVHQNNNWLTDTDQKQMVRIRSWKVFNSDGSIWIEVDNEGYAIEHYYDKNGIEIETVNPSLGDYTDFAQPITIVNGTPAGSDFNDFSQSGAFNSFLLSRQLNPGARMIVDYHNGFILTMADIQKNSSDPSVYDIKITSVQKDGLGNVLEEKDYTYTPPVTPYNGDLDEFFSQFTEHAVKSMVYDDLGRMVALTDPDAGSKSINDTVHGQVVKKTDKTWIVKYDDLGRKKLVYYPQTTRGRVHVKQLLYHDADNSITTIDEELRKTFARSDWDGNLVEVVRYGSYTTPTDQKQTYQYQYDPFGRKIKFTDAKGIVTRYSYDERNLLTKQDYGNGSDIMQYNNLGQLISKTDRNGNRIEFTYDQMGRNTESNHFKPNLDTEDPDDLIPSHSVKMSYDNRGNAVRIANQNLVEHYIYDYANRVIKLERHILNSEVRDLISRDIWADSGDDQIFTFEYQYNAAGMVTQMTYPDQSIHQFDYDTVLGQLNSLSEGTDAMNMNPFVTSLLYNKSGVVTQMDYANNTRQTWEFDNRKRIKNITITDTNPETADPVIANLNYTLNGAGDVLSINDNEYQYDGFDRIIGAKTYIGNGEDLRKLVAKYFGTYQDGDAVNGVLYNPQADIFPEGAPDGRINGQDHFQAIKLGNTNQYDVERFEYDQNGNRTKLVQNGDYYSYEYGERNRLEMVKIKKKDETAYSDFIKYTYDNNGNTTQRIIYAQAPDQQNQIIDFIYDTMNRLIKTEENAADNDKKVSEYFYDNAGNRFIKTTEDQTTVYLRHGQIAVAMDIEITMDDNTTDVGTVNRYVLSGDLLAGRISKNFIKDLTTDIVTSTINKYWYHLDHLNSTKCVTKSDGSLEVMYEYRAFGEQLKKLGEGEAKYTYGGKELDDQTNLYYFNARYYDATIGRFINVDPVQDGMNWYVYCNNNPLSFVDPTGLNEEKNKLDIEGLVNKVNKGINAFNKANEILLYGKYNSLSKMSSLAQTNGWENPVYTIGFSASGNLVIQDGNVSAGYFFEPKNDNLGFQTAYMDYISNIANAKDNPIALLKSGIALSYLIKNSKNFGIYGTTPVLGGAAPIPVGPNSWASASLTIESGIYRSLKDFSGGFHEIGGSGSFNFLTSPIGFLGFAAGGNIVKNMNNENIGMTVEFGLSTGPSAGPGIEGHWRAGASGYFSITDSLRKLRSKN